MSSDARVGSIALSVLLGVGTIAWSPRAAAQSCCAGAAAVTPGRLSMHEEQLVGLQARAATVLGSFDAAGDYRANPAGASEIGGGLARRLGAEYATYTVVLDANETVLYRGGIDSDRTHLTTDAEPFLANALDDLLAGRAPRKPATKALGCALEVE